MAAASDNILRTAALDTATANKKRSRTRAKHRQQANTGDKYRIGPRDHLRADFSSLLRGE
jgi:hypothetical protein